MHENGSDSEPSRSRHDHDASSSEDAVSVSSLSQMMGQLNLAHVSGRTRSDSESSHSRHDDDASSSADAVSVSTDSVSSLSQMMEQLKRARIQGRTEETFPCHILPNDLLFDRILDHASPGTLVCLSKTCRYARNAVDHYMPRAFDINKALSRYFKNPIAFRSLQAATSTLISGSFALQFLGRLHYPDSDLDLYCNYKSRVSLGEFLLDEGYAFAPNSRQDPVFHIAATQPIPPLTTNPYARMRYVYTVYTFTKPIAEDSDEKLKVQIIVARDIPMEVVLHFHSTCVMNVIAYDRAYSLYPRATFEERISLYCAPYLESAAPAVEKYRTRGFAMVYDLPPGYWRVLPFLSSRWIGDRDAWSIPLSLGGITPPPPPSRMSQPLPTDPCYFTTWELKRRHRPATGRTNCAQDEERPAFYVVCDILKTEGFAHRYAFTRNHTMGGRLRHTVQVVRHLYTVGREAAKWGLKSFDQDDSSEVPVTEREPDLCVDAELLRWCQLVLSPQGQNAWTEWN